MIEFVIQIAIWNFGVVKKNGIYKTKNTDLFGSTNRMLLSESSTSDAFAHNFQLTCFNDEFSFKLKNCFFLS